MNATNKPSDGSQAPTATLDSFFKSLESRTTDPIHLRLLRAARKPNHTAALEREFSKVVEELLREG